MILVLDIGNTNMKCGLFENRMLIRSWRMKSSMDKTSDELGMEMVSFFQLSQL